SATRNGRVGVIGTVGTIASGAYQRAVAATGAEVELRCAACPGFVEFVERGETGSDQVHVLAERLLAPLCEAGVDALLLGCTHYPFLARTISDVVGREVVLVSSADETAFELRSLLAGAVPARDPEAGAGRHVFLSSGDVGWFESLGRQLLGPELGRVEQVSWR
ncbi:MAG: aspartate/glutamate racemase family protein, partial [Actinomycetota bacterium]|nr:aspartate/glutamate racemase family protein [Actinomycetota bacterium]